MLHGALSELLRECVCLSHILLLPYHSSAGLALQEQPESNRAEEPGEHWVPGTGALVGEELAVFYLTETNGQIRWQQEQQL